jgi:predicted peptidase
MISRRILFLALTIIMAAVALGGQAPRGAADRVQRKTYLFKETNETIEYAVFVSSKVDARKKSPLVLALHGAGVPPAEMTRSLAELAEKYGYIVAAPMGYNLRGFYGAAGPGNTRGGPENLGELSEKDVMNVLGMVRQEFNVDPERIYIVGQSMGGGGAIYLGVKYKEIWAAIAASAAAIPAQHQPEVLADIKETPVMLVHGLDDQAVPIETIRPWIAKMKELRMTYEFVEVAKTDHSETINKGAEQIFSFFNKHSR